jgi:hypothetical protein
MHTGCRWGNLRIRDLLENIGVDGRMLLKWTLKKYYGFAWYGISWLSIRTSGGLL